MKLLFDENLSRRIVPALEFTYPGTTHVVFAGLEQADDRTVWTFAKDNSFVIVTKDDDFTELLSLLGHPPKVIRLAFGNCTNQAVINALTHAHASITETFSTSTIGLIEIY